MMISICIVLYGISALSMLMFDAILYVILKDMVSKPVLYTILGTFTIIPVVNTLAVIVFASLAIYGANTKEVW